MAFDYKLTAKEEARKEAVQTKIRSDLAALNLTCDMDALLELPSIRLFIISEGAGLPDHYLEEVKRIPAVAEQVRRAEVVRQLADGSSETHQTIAAMSPARRMSLGRVLEAKRQAVDAAKPKPTLSAEDEAKALIMLRGISHPASRLAMAREIGLA